MNDPIWLWFMSFALLVLISVVKIVVAKHRLEARKNKVRDASANLYLEIVERKRAVELFRLVVEAAPNGLLMINESGMIIMANSQIEKLFYYSKKDLLGQSVELLVPERFRGHHLANRNAFSIDPKARSMGSGRELLALRKDGSEFPVEIGLSPIKMPTGTYVLASILDISERKAMEEVLWQSKERFRSMIENVKDHAIFMLDIEGRVLTWNKGAERLRGYRADEIIGKHYSCFYLAEDRESGKPERLLRMALAEGQYEEEGWRLRKDGSTFWASCVIAVVRNAEGKPIGFSNVTHDLTRHRQVEEDLRHAKEEADAANKAKSAFLANISHEIRTPMTGIIGMTGLLVDTELSPKQREYCELIRRSGESLLTVINEVLDFSKVESGKLQVELINFELRSTVEEVVNLFAKEAADKGVELINFIRNDVPMELRGDPGRLRQILSNLISNALKFTEEGEVVVLITLIKETETHANLRFSVTDTGIGIPQEKLAKLFDPFTQVDASITRKYGGTGLGLAICRKFVELLGGQIGVYSDEGKGSTFWFTLQLLKQREGIREAVTPRPNFQGLRMLIVEENSTNRSVLAHYLASLGIKSQCAADGHTALKQLRIAAEKGTPFNLAILGSRLPRMQGLELAQAIKQDPDIGSPKLVLLTSVAQEADARLGQEADVDAYLTKPISFSCLSECLAVLMGKTPRDDSSRSLVTRHRLTELERQQRLRVLVADDNYINQKVTASLLENMGHGADVVGNGKEAIEALRIVPYDVILMDVQMPEMDGFEASRQIRALEEKTGRHTPVIAITAYARTEDRESCIAAGMDDYISKPIKPQELKAAISRMVTGARTSPTYARADSAAQAGVLDFSEALAQVEGNRELLCEIARIFLDQYPKLLEEAHQAFSRSDYRSLKGAAHTLASSAGQLAARRAFAAAKKLELASNPEDVFRLPRAFAELEKELQLLGSAVLDSGDFTPRPAALLH